MHCFIYGIIHQWFKLVFWLQSRSCQWFMFELWLQFILWCSTFSKNNSIHSLGWQAHPAGPQVWIHTTSSNVTSMPVSHTTSSISQINNLFLYFLLYKVGTSPKEMEVRVYQYKASIRSPASARGRNLNVTVVSSIIFEWISPRTCFSRLPFREKWQTLLKYARNGLPYFSGHRSYPRASGCLVRVFTFHSLILTTFFFSWLPFKLSVSPCQLPIYYFLITPLFATIYLSSYCTTYSQSFYRTRPRVSLTYTFHTLLLILFLLLLFLLPKGSNASRSIAPDWDLIIYLTRSSLPHFVLPQRKIIEARVVVILWLSRGHGALDDSIMLGV